MYLKDREDNRMKNKYIMMDIKEEVDTEVIVVKRKDTIKNMVIKKVEIIKEKGNMIEDLKESIQEMRGIILEMKGIENIKDKEIMVMRGIELEKKIEIDNEEKMIIHIITIQKSQDTKINMIKEMMKNNKINKCSGKERKSKQKMNKAFLLNHNIKIRVINMKIRFKTIDMKKVKLKGKSKNNKKRTKWMTRNVNNNLKGKMINNHFICRIIQ